jgi:hypothetical protein
VASEATSIALYPILNDRIVNNNPPYKIQIIWIAPPKMQRALIESFTLLGRLSGFSDHLENVLPLK